ncbi:cytochrome o ubiquinol oxidase subunit IV [Solirhodobacter olei]|uniref:cytochrome o ubiquinol oxidase subunit IV n=1 Tax=Solirhodobacter olei TaxID=2493082 RepID=UPI000FDC8E21|nr:cytochrome o ubiquinol oxidase subunit IV [Solirhodobacter olei]
MSHDANPDTHEEFGAHGTVRGYLTGFVLSVILTAIPFWLVVSRATGPLATAVLILAMALIQIGVHMIYFLHLNTRSEGGWNILAAIFTVVLVVIAISGSIWVMYNLDINMMPMSGNQIGAGQ